jgi:Na+/H+ antiporter NhaD/arsenite permease-like protein
MTLNRVLEIGSATVWPAIAWAAGAGEGAGTAPGPLWALPFAGLLLTIAFLPMLVPRLWHRRMGLIAAAWSLALLLPLAALHGPALAWHDAWHAALLEYLPFVSLLLALFTAGGGILLEGGPWGTPAGNTALLALGTALAGVMGTTGVAMVLIHPLLRANAHRTRKVHLVVFFIVLAANAGGATTPLGDPPLYLGFLHGVPFGWPLRNLTGPLLVLALPLLAGFWLLDRRLARSEPKAPPALKLRVRGWRNAGLVALVVAAVLVQGVWQPGEVALLGQKIGLERLLGMLTFAAITLVSLAVTPRTLRQRNLFTWEPMTEVAVLFAAIFITIGPVLDMLAAGPAGPLAPLLALTSDAAGRPSPLAYFWLAGMLSGLLDNAPTYLVFFQLAGSDPATLTGELAPVLRALSAGAVFFGALTYVGNAPNMMVRAIAAHRGVRMPGFFGYMAWSCALLALPFGLLTLLYFLP